MHGRYIDWRLGGTSAGDDDRRSTGRLVSAGVVFIMAVMAAVVMRFQGPAASAGDLVLKPSADAYVSSSDADRNYGSATTLWVDDAPVLRTYLRFDLPAMTSPITRATLSMHPTRSGQFGVRSVPSTWGESTLTYRNG